MTDHRGWESLGYAIVEQAINDVRGLKRAGIIVEGRCTRRWPTVFVDVRHKLKGKPEELRKRAMNKIYLSDYQSKQDVDELLYFIRCGALKELLEMLDSRMEAETIARLLEL